MAKKKKRQPDKGAKPPPKCKAILLCERLIVDAQTGTASIICVFNALSVPRLPGRTRPFQVYLHLTNGIGRYNIVVEIHDLRKDEIIGRGSGLGIAFTNRLEAIQFAIPVPSLPIVHDGAYDLVVLADGQEIDRQQFAVLVGERPTQAGQEYEESGDGNGD